MRAKFWGVVCVAVCGAIALSQGTLDIAVLGTIGTLNPFLATTGVERTAVGWVYETLAQVIPGGQKPFLAESWEVSPPQKKIVFHLRHGVKWHDGKGLTAEDVAFTLNYIRQKHLPMWMVMAFVAGAKAVDTYHRGGRAHPVHPHGDLLGGPGHPHHPQACLGGNREPHGLS